MRTEDGCDTRREALIAETLRANAKSEEAAARLKSKPHVSANLYGASKMDRDKVGVASEQG